ncbi:hypothetical protein, partial [Shigella flexneri]|uniref:hypothetical protein n=1 Tax=Shigella flexneri TaxID=623 RepID=UPI0019D41A57
STLKSPSYTKSVSWQHYPIISGKPNTATTAVPPSKPAPGSEGYRAISLSLFQISSILGSGE